MQYSIQIEKTSETLNDVARLVTSLEQDRILSAILAKRMTHDQVVDYTSHLQEKRLRQHREIDSLRRFAATFNKEYATDSNRCFSSAKSLFGVIRSSMKETLRIFRSFCPRVQASLPVADGLPPRPSVLDHTLLSPDVSVMPPLFPPEDFDPCVVAFLDELKSFFQDLEGALVMCDDVLMEEKMIREDAEKCRLLYENCCNQVIASSRELLAYLGPDAFAREDEMSAQMRQASLQDFITGHFHMHSRGEFRIHVLHKIFSDGLADDLSDIETFLWPADHGMALRARTILLHFDELRPRGRQIGNSGRYRLAGVYVAVFMKWCGIKDSKKEKQFVERYFKASYHGEFEPVASTTVNTAKNNLLRDEATESRILEEIRLLAVKYGVA